MRPGSALEALWALFSGPGCVSLAGRQVIFADEPARAFVNGGWLEEFVHAAVQSLPPSSGVHDLARGVAFQWGDGNRNEFDVVFLADNRLHVIECKPKVLTDSTDVNATLYKADSLVRHMGSQVRRMLVSLYPLGSLAARRARTLRLDVVDGERPARPG